MLLSNYIKQHGTAGEIRLWLERFVMFFTGTFSISCSKRISAIQILISLTIIIIFRESFWINSLKEISLLKINL